MYGIDPLYLVYVIVAASVLLLVEGLYFLIRDQHSGEGAVNRRMRMLAGGVDSESALRKLRRDPLSGITSQFAYLFRPLDRIIGEAGLMVSTARMVLYQSAGFILIFALMRFVLHMYWWQALIGAIGLGLVLPIFVLVQKRNRRLKHFAEQLPDTLDLMVRSLRVGHPVPTAMGMIAKEMPDPVGSEFGMAVDEMTYGFNLEQALSNMSQRVPLRNLRFMVVAVQIQQSTGGNLAEILQNLSTVIRERFAMMAKVKAVSAEGKFGGRLVGALPVAVAGIILMLRPEYFSGVSQDPLFRPLIGVAAGLWIGGQVAISRLTKIKI